MKKRIKKLTLLIIMTVIATVMLTGCNKNTDNPATIRVGALKGPTTMGLLHLMSKAGTDEMTDRYEFAIATGADELLPLMVKGEMDIALVPANVASILYNKTEGGICVIDINTLGVLYMVSADTSIKSILDLAGKTVYLTGMGTTPDYVLQYLLEQNGIDNCQLEYKSEATEVAAVLSKEPDKIGLLPQPFVTAACMQNESLQVVLSMNEQWSSLQKDGAGMVTGVTVVRKAFLEQNEDAVLRFLKEHKESAKKINEDPERGASLCVEAGIVAKEPIALRAIPQCNITCVTGKEMKQALSDYLTVLYEKSKESVGGNLPGEDFYYLYEKVK